MSRWIEVARLAIRPMYVAIDKYWQKNLIKIFEFWCQRHNKVHPSIKLYYGGRQSNFHGRGEVISFPSIGYSWLIHDWCLYLLLWCYIIYSLNDGHVTISVLELDFCPSEYIYKRQKWWPYWIAVAWADFAAPIGCCTERVGALYRRLMAFLTHGSFVFRNIPSRNVGSGVILRWRWFGPYSTLPLRCNGVSREYQYML